VTSIYGILAVGRSSQSADPPGGWGTPLIVIGTLLATVLVVVLVVEPIDLRIELNRWLRKLMDLMDSDRREQ
jgi:hypothetical protein